MILLSNRQKSEKNSVYKLTVAIHKSKVGYLDDHTSGENLKCELVRYKHALHEKLCQNCEL